MIPLLPDSNLELTSSIVIRDRRSKRRFCTNQDLRYELLGDHDRIIGSGGGTILNISSAGVCFTTENGFTRGAKVKLTISWPVLLDGRVRIKLIIRGAVLRATSNTVVAKTEAYGFYTRSL